MLTEVLMLLAIEEARGGSAWVASVRSMSASSGMYRSSESNGLNFNVPVKETK